MLNLEPIKARRNIVIPLGPGDEPYLEDALALDIDALIAEVERLREALAKVARAKAREKKGRVPSGAR